MPKLLPVAGLLLTALIGPARAESQQTPHAAQPAPRPLPAALSPAVPHGVPIRAVPAQAAPAGGPVTTLAVPLVPPPPAVVQPTGPLVTPAAMVARPDKVLIEAIAVAGHRLVACGLDGLVILSDDNGANWRQVAVPVQATLTALHFTDDHVGWAVGHYGAVLRTSDAGEHWTLVEDGPRAMQAMLDAARATNDADSVRARKIQAAAVLMATNPGRPFLLIQSSGSDTIRLIGADTLSAETTDGGKQWRPWSDGIGNPEGRRLDGLASRDGVVLVAGAHGTLLAGRPEDGLHTVPPPFDGAFFGVLDGGAFGFVVFGQQGHAYATTALGPDWTPGKEVAWHAVDDPSQTTLTAGMVRQNDSVILGDASGATWKLAGKPESPRLEPGPADAPFPILALAEAPDHGLILAGSGGIVRSAPPP